VPVLSNIRGFTETSPERGVRGAHGPGTAARVTRRRHRRRRPRVVLRAGPPPV